MATRKNTITIGIALAVAILASITPVWIAVPLWVIAALLFGWGLQPKSTEEFVGRLPGSSYILKSLAKLDPMLSKLARVTEEQFDEQKNVGAPDDQDQTPQSAVMQPTAPAIPEPGELEIEPPKPQPTPPIELPPDSSAPPEVPPQQPPQPPQMKSALGNVAGVVPDSKD
jgi:outer membrane biosynthesis protein TonB